ncbi:proton-conducting transporter transmembrane domain-containing protein [Pararhodospirillum oryzae]|uniref:Cation:proton antiporter n=1 Tax=Pararhodospirillum oryzae TaxID=478448 RepID=A0A512HBG9_9PROT|nr:proton-conducting transporter membrane subunit [Pararhodospirillum oryzae]GEO82806.1 cation:proton antiporter [Pararhodospirillum oryzae]
MSVLAWIVATPLLGAVLIALARRPFTRDLTLLLIALATLAQVLPLISPVLAGERPAVTLATVMPGIDITLSVEPLGLIFALVASILWVVASLYAIGYVRANALPAPKRFHACFALAIGAALGVALADNLFTLFLFYETLTLTTYPLVTHGGSPEAVRAGRVYLGILLSTSIGLFLLGIVWVFSLTGRLDFVPGGLLNGVIEGPALAVLLGLFVFGIGKAALMPVHRWLPAAMVAPAPVSALLHAVAVVKAGVFTVLKVIVYTFGPDLLANTPAAHWLMYVAGFSVIAASLIAWRQDNLKARLAYSTISQLAYIVLGASLFVPAALTGAAVHLVAHAFAKITLFFAAGAITTATGMTRVSQMNGLGRRLPWTMAFFSIAALSMIGVPPTAGFVSKWLLLGGAFDAQAWVAVGVLILSTVLNAAYFLPIVHAAWFRPPSADPPDDDSHEAHGAHAHGAVSRTGEAPFLLLLAMGLSTLGVGALFVWPDLPVALARSLP